MPPRHAPSSISVIVPVRDAAATLCAQLDALRTQVYAGEWELIVSDDGSRDGSRALAVSWTERHGLGRVVGAGRRGPGGARNAGAAIARGELLAFCDADDVVSAGWLRALAGAAAHGDLIAGAFSGEGLNSRQTLAWASFPAPNEPHLGFLPIAPGGNSAFWRDAFETLGGFPTASRCGEDAALSWRAQLRGMTLVPAPRALVYRRLPPSHWATLHRFAAYGMGDVWLYGEFAAQGMPRRSRREAFALWREVALGMPSLRQRPERLGRLAQMLGLCAGRLVGSARRRTLYL